MKQRWLVLILLAASACAHAESWRISLGADLHLNTWSGNGLTGDFKSQSAQLGFQLQGNYGPWLAGVAVLGGEFDFDGVNPGLQAGADRDGSFNRGEADLVLGYAVQPWLTIYTDFKSIEYHDTVADEKVKLGGVGIGGQGVHYLSQHTLLHASLAVLNGTATRNGVNGNGLVSGLSVGVMYFFTPEFSTGAIVKQQAVRYEVGSLTKDHAMASLIFAARFHF